MKVSDKMKKIVIGTTNKNKVERIKRLFNNEKYEFFALNEVCEKIGEPEETADNPVDISIQKAMFYVNYIPDGYIVLTQDDTLEFENIAEEDNPGTHIKEPVIKKYEKFTDENAAKYYTDLAKKYGGSIPMKFTYGHAIASINKNNRTVKTVIAAQSSLKAKLVDKVTKLEEVPGYFLSALMQVEVDGKWIDYNNLNEKELIASDVDLYKSISELLKRVE